MADKKYYWEDMQPGKVLTYGGMRVTREEIIAFAEEFDPEIFHLDEDAANDSLLNGLSASGWHSCSMLMRLMCEGFILDAASMGSPGIEEARWLKPVRPDDVLSGRTTCLESRTSKNRPNMGLVYFITEMLNQHNEVVVTLKSWAMYERRNPGAPIEKTGGEKTGSEKTETAR